MNRERLTTLLDILENKVGDAQFDIQTFMSRTACGTTGCALGWYAHHTGEMVLVFCGEDDTDGDVEPPEGVDVDIIGTFGFAASHFGITREETDGLFLDFKYEGRVSRTDVTRRIRDLLEDKPAAWRNPAAAHA